MEIKRSPHSWIREIANGLLALGVSIASVALAEDVINLHNAKKLYEKSQRGDKLTVDEQKYLKRARQDANSDPPKWQEQSSTGLIPLNAMSSSARYKGEEGGLYGDGNNLPPQAQQSAALGASKRITTLDVQGRPSPEGKIVFISLGMSNTAGEFMTFKELADRDPDKSPAVSIVNSVGGRDQTPRR